MSLLTDLSSVLGAKIVVTSPATGRSLWLDPAGFLPYGATTATGIEMPFTFSVSTGTMPTDGSATDSLGTFLMQEKFTILDARGPAGIPWIFWLAGVVALALLPLVLSHRK